jgi:mRNA interferase MazF
MRLRRGEIWWVALDPTVGSEIAKTRPCVVISNSAANDRRKTVMVVPFSTSPKAYPPFTVPVRCQGRDVSAIIDQTRAVAKERFRTYIEVCSPRDLAVIEEALRPLLQI